jgi:hypothetical protein
MLTSQVARGTKTARVGSMIQRSHRQAYAQMNVHAHTCVVEIRVFKVTSFFWNMFSCYAIWSLKQECLYSLQLVGSQDLGCQDQHGRARTRVRREREREREREKGGGWGARDIVMHCHTYLAVEDCSVSASDT